MTMSIEHPASDEHVSPWPVFGAPCCGRPITDRQPIPPPNMLLGVDGMVIMERRAMDPDLRGLAAPRPWSTRTRPGPRFGACDCDSARRTALSGLGGSLGSFTADAIAEARDIATRWAASNGWAVPPMPSDAIEAIWRLSLTERELELLRQKLRSMRGAGIPLSSADTQAYKTAADSYYKAALGVYTPITNMLRRTSPGIAALIPPVTRPPSLDAPDRPLPWTLTEGDVALVRRGDFSSASGRFAELIATVRARASGRGVSGLGLFGIDDLTIGTLLLIAVIIASVAAAAIAVAIGATAIAAVAIAWIAARAAMAVAENRRIIYERCLTAGTGTADCARQASELAPMPVYPPIPSPVSINMGTVAIGLGLAGAAYYFLATPGGRATAGLHNFKSRNKFKRR